MSKREQLLLTRNSFLEKELVAKNRELEIEASLEKVRARTMSMQKAAEFVEVIDVIGEQFIHLGFDFDWVNFSANGLDVSKAIDIWNFVVVPGLYQGATRLVIPFFEHPVFTKAEESVNEYYTTGNSFTVVLLDKKDKDTFLDHLFTNTIYKDLPDEAKTSQYNREVYQTSNIVLKDTWLSVGKYDAKPLTDEQIAILKRLANEFGQAYTRFVDLQKAEAQAREAKIEVALERVRARTMAMQKSDELADVATLLFRQVNDLGIKTWTTGFNIWSDDNNAYEDWLASPGGGFIEPYVIDATAFSEFKALSDAKKSGTEFFILCQEGETLRETYKQLSRFATKNQFEKVLEEGFEFPSRQFVHMVFGSKVSLMFITYEPVPEAHDIFKRFGKVFNQTYTRFLDLQKTEAQAREAKIEAALERIRGKAMAMHTTQDLSDTIGAFYHELQSFSLTPIRCGVGLLEKEERIGELYTWYTTEKGQSLELIGRLKMAGHPVLNKIYEGWLSQTEYHPVLRGNEIKRYYKILRPQMNFPDFGHDEVQFGYFFFFPEGGVYAWMEKEMQEDELRIYRRFTSVLSLTYKRYRDMQKAEANAKEAVKQSALDRIRADIASMRTTQDLERITPLIWNELTILGVPFIRCGVFIMDETQRLIHSFLSTPEGKAIAAFHLPYDAAGELSDVLVYWRKNEIFKDHWDKAKFTNWTKSLVEHGAITSEEKYSTAHPPVNLDLYFLPFLQGMLYIGSEVPLTNAEIQLAQTLANAFSTAYARYEDFNKLEAAKKQIEKTLSELKQAQAQLIQSEKMASLGELTAGIAHEIQNPLNFVNNFSEVNQEMIDELKNELATGNWQLANDIADDIKSNEEKINHHGKRADAIVKGMLQHSRKSSGQKEPTDINALADEYLRLSYHGLRAKDKSFNATIETDFDKSIGKINVIPQDIGRVFLNLFNNAFYACAERSRSPVNQQKNPNPVSYNPTVSVKTEKCDDKVYITVRDNGNGIPQKIIDKIFQPFFTTKPTGEGTGLGLSLSYDIVKAHGGEIKVESKEGEGTEFIIQIPINNPS